MALVILTLLANISAMPKDNNPLIELVQSIEHTQFSICPRVKEQLLRDPIFAVPDRFVVIPRDKFPLTLLVILQLFIQDKFSVIPRDILALTLLLILHTEFNISLLPRVNIAGLDVVIDIELAKTSIIPILTSPYKEEFV